ncbi:MAG: RNA polymerase sigma factor [Bacteroidota bacterium]
MTKKWLDHVLNQHHTEAYLWARQCCGFDDEAAKDVLQMVYLKILEGKAKYNQKAEVKTWIFSVIRNTAIDHRKSMKILYPLDMVKTKAEEKDMTEYEDYQATIQKLPERQRQVILLVFYHGRTLEEAAGILELGIGTVRTHYDRGKKALKELILKTTKDGY